jgi:hypothetical protein
MLVFFSKTGDKDVMTCHTCLDHSVTEAAKKRKHKLKAKSPKKALSERNSSITKPFQRNSRKVAFDLARRQLVRMLMLQQPSSILPLLLLLLRYLSALKCTKIR